jgi:hypothetical protein
MLTVLRGERGRSPHTPHPYDRRGKRVGLAVGIRIVAVAAARVRVEE